MKKIFLIIFLGSLLFPLISLADIYKARDAAGNEFDVCYQGLVPCGKEIKFGSVGLFKGKEDTCEGGTATTTPCQLCHFFVMLDGIIDFILFKIIPPLAVLMLVIGGFMFMVAYLGGAEMLPGGVKGGPTMLSQAKKLVTSVAIGLLIIFAAWIIISTILVFIGLAEWAGFLKEGWFMINCPISL